MKFFLFWFTALLAIMVCALLLFQNFEVLMEVKTLNLLSADLFGFTYGTVSLPLVGYLFICILFGAGLMFVPAVRMWLTIRKLKKTVRNLENELEPTLTESMPDPGDDLVYKSSPDQTL